MKTNETKKVLKEDQAKRLFDAFVGKWRHTTRFGKPFVDKSRNMIWATNMECFLIIDMEYVEVRGEYSVYEKSSKYQIPIGEEIGYIKHDDLKRQLEENEDCDMFYIDEGLHIWKNYLHCLLKTMETFDVEEALIQRCFDGDSYRFEVTDGVIVFIFTENYKVDCVKELKWYKD